MENPSENRMCAILVSSKNGNYYQSKISNLKFFNLFIEWKIDTRTQDEGVDRARTFIL